MSTTLHDFDFLKIFHPTTTEQSKIKNSNDSIYKRQIFLGAGIAVLGFAIFMFLSFADAESFDSKVFEKTQSIQISPSEEPQKNERFGDAFTIMSKQVQPGVDQPVLESFDNVPKPSKRNSEN